MAYHYVKHTGTNTGDTSYATMRTGAFGSGDLINANVYADVETCIANATIVDGDFIMVSDAHSHTETTVNTEIGIAVDGATLYIVSVSDTNADQYSRGAEEKTGPTHADIYFVGNAGSTTVHRGMDYVTYDNFQVNTAGIRHVFDDCLLEFTTASGADEFLAMSAEQIMEFWNSQFKFVAAGQGFQLLEGEIRMRGVSGATGTTKVDGLVEILAGAGSFIIDIRDTDLDSMMAANSELIFGDGGSLDNINYRALIHLHNCKLPSGFSIHNESPLAIPHYEFFMTSCHVGDNYFQTYYEVPEGTIEDDTTQYLDLEYEGTSKLSFKFTTSAEANDVKPLRHPIGILPAQDIATANQTMTVEFVSSDSGLTDTDVWFEFETQDDTDQSLGVLHTTRNATALGAGNGSSHTTSSAVWNVTTNTEYKETKDLGAFTNPTNSNVVAYACVAKPSITVNFNSPTIAAT